MNDKYTTLLIKVKGSGNMIGMKEDIAMRLAGAADIVRIDVAEDAAAVVRCKDCRFYQYSEKCRTGYCDFHECEETQNHYCCYGER